MEKLIHIYAEAAGNTFLQLVLIAVVIDTIFGVLRAIKERRLLIISLGAAWRPFLPSCDL